MRDVYDVQQVCENGHQITSGFFMWPAERKNFCEECGAPTLTECPKCGQEIQGSPFIEGPRKYKTLESIVSVPKYCRNCGTPYSWTQKWILTAIQIFRESGNLNGNEEDTIEQDIENISKDIPETELSANRIQRIWRKGKAVGYEVIMELASRTAAKILKGPYP
ncbi:MAG: DUF2321 domain-containing protein [Sedimentisphaerales bacterium]|nr:DUF2321 domain-containing protein [Sedimentisphaerales bacterium]